MSWKILVGVSASLALAAVLGALMFKPEAMEALPIDRSVFLPGATTDGHYQIELQCEGCHTSDFADRAALQSACEGCHAEELEGVDDSHPQTKFSDPRNADRIEVLDARWCVTCHQEHRPELTSTMGLSLPVDYCYRCHEDVGEDRPTHRDLPFDGCASAGCHNFHDNRALFEDFLIEHRDAPPNREASFLPVRALLAWSLERDLVSGKALTASEHDAPDEVPALERWVAEWEGSSHADAGVNCRGCHVLDDEAWQDSPSVEACSSCHADEKKAFLASRHGMRIAAGLSPMTPAMARLPMHPEAQQRELDCNSCHSAHAFNTHDAAEEACLECHADEHSLAFEGTAHQGLGDSEEAGTAVSCATCHFPRVMVKGHTRVAHNQNDFLRPNEKMIRPVCMNCHGLGFSLDSLADSALVTTNFHGPPTRKVESIHYAAELRWQLEGRTPPWKDKEKKE